jgi:N-acetyl sugar amidotransferase
VNYCANCILPDSRPGLKIGQDGVCSACRSHSGESAPVDWDARHRQFAELVGGVRAVGADWDCVIPVSGGKDSTWQVITCLEHGLKPLAVTWRTPVRTALGERNLQNLIELGVDHMDVTVNPRVERRFLLASLERFGTPAIPMHLAIFNIPTAIAVRNRVPLIVWGENSAMEYVGGEDEAASFDLTPEWVRKYGAVHGTTADDWVSDDLPSADLAVYRGPTGEQMAAAGTRAVFLGMFFEWDPQETFEIARRHGFEPDSTPRTGAYAYADIDDDFISIHHWLKWLKFGFTRVWDNLSLEIRNGRLSRDEAIGIVRDLGDQTPHEDIDLFCRYVGIDRDRFFAIAETFRDTDIWTLRDGVWRIDDFLIDDWPWEAA